MNARIIKTGEIKSFYPTRECGYDGYVDNDGKFYYPTELDFKNCGKVETVGTLNYVTCEQAVALKRLGFSEKCDHIYIRTSEESDSFEFANWKVEDADYNRRRRPQLFISAPRIEQVHDWLISKGYFIAVEWYAEDLWRYGIYRKACPAFFNNTMKPSYKEIMSSAITEALKLIERDELV